MKMIIRADVPFWYPKDRNGLAFRLALAKPISRINVHLITSHPGTSLLLIAID